MTDVVFHMTGFGRFQGVEVNPSSYLVTRLPEFVRTNANVHRPPLSHMSVAGTRVMEVSMAAVDEAMAEVQAGVVGGTGATATPTVHVLLHFGVAASAPAFSLEQCAYNEADFRVPDERGQQPRRVAIDQGQPLGRALTTTLPLPAICATLQAGGHGVDVSTNPGRFLCNWCYYRSLQVVQSLTAPTALAHALFVHVPSLTTVPLDDQLAFACDLVCAITKALQPGSPLMPPMPVSATALPTGVPTAAGAGVGATSGAGLHADATATALAAAIAASKDGDIAAAELIVRAAAAAAEVATPTPPAPAPGATDSTSTTAPTTGTPFAAAFEEAVGTLVTEWSLDRGLAVAALSATAWTPADLSAPVAWAFDRLDSGDATEPLSAPDPGPGMSRSGGGGGGGSGSWLASMEGGRPGDRSSKMVIVVRDDLGMGKGKVAAQACHAALKAVHQAQAQGGSGRVREWQSQGEPIIVLKCDGLEHLTSLQRTASACGLNVAMVRDAGRTQVDPGTITVLAIGPDAIPSIDAVTSSLKLL